MSLSLLHLYLFALFGLVGFDSLAYRQISSVETRRQSEELVTLRWGAELVAEGMEDPEHTWTPPLPWRKGDYSSFCLAPDANLAFSVL